MRPFVITGTGRCGTHWLSRVLSTLGLECGHERVWNPTTIATISWETRWNRDRRDSSWLAAPFLAQLDGPVIIQMIRREEDTSDSLMARGFFSGAKRASCPYTQHAISSLRGNCPPDEREACRWFWREWNAMILRESPAFIFNLETVTADQIVSLIECVAPGRHIIPRHVESAMREAARNERPRAA